MKLEQYIQSTDDKLCKTECKIFRTNNMFFYFQNIYILIKTNDTSDNFYSNFPFKILNSSVVGCGV